LAVLPIPYAQHSKDSQNLLRRIGKGKALGITKIAKSLAAKALDGDIVAAKFYLSHQAGWTETKRTELTGRDGDPIEIDMHWTIEVVE
jgi:hypothetical protein